MRSQTVTLDAYTAPETRKDTALRSTSRFQIGGVMLFFFSRIARHGKVNGKGTG